MRSLLSRSSASSCRAIPVAVVPNIVLARDVVAQQQFDVVLCDYDLNDGKGTEFVQECRAHRSTIPVIAVSAHDQGNAALV